MTSIFEGKPLKTRPTIQPKQGSLGFQVDGGNSIILLCSPLLRENYHFD